MASKKVAILTAVGGQGHMTAANALDYWLSEWGYNTIVLNVGPSANQDIYEFLLKTPFAYKSFFMVSDHSKVSGMFVKAFSKIVEKSLTKTLPKYGDFDAVISTYPLVHPHKSKMNIMLLLDPTVHASYLTSPVMDCYLNYWGEGDSVSKNCKLNAANTYTIGPLAKPWFYKRSTELQTRSKADLKKELGFNETDQVCLVMAGGGWIERSEDYIEHLVEKFKDSTVKFVFACGKNHAFYSEMKDKYKNNPQLMFLDWLNEEKMSFWMAASDFGLAFSIAQMVIESGLCALPLYIFDYISGQENGYLAVIDKHAIGKFIDGSDKEQIDQFYTLVAEGFHVSLKPNMSLWQKYLAGVPEKAKKVFQEII